MTEININDDRGRAGAKALTVGTKLMGYFGGEPVPYGTDDRGRASAKALTAGTKLMGYFGGEPVPTGTIILAQGGH